MLPLVATLQVLINRRMWLDAVLDAVDTCHHHGSEAQVGLPDGSGARNSMLSLWLEPVIGYVPQRNGGAESRPVDCARSP